MLKKLIKKNVTVDVTPMSYDKPTKKRLESENKDINS